MTKRIRAVPKRSATVVRHTEAQPAPQRNGSAGKGRGWPGGRGKQDNQSLALPDISRTPPHSVEAEQGILGSILISPKEATGECVEVITEEYFYIPAHQTIYEVLVELWKANIYGDLLTFTQVLRDRNILESVGGASFITSLFTFVPTAANIGYYIEIVRDKFILRELIKFGTDTVRRGFEEQGEARELLADVEGKALTIRPSEHTRVRGIKDDVMEAFEAIERLYETKGQITGLPTGFVDLDRMTSGLHAQEMTVIAGRPSMGKTALAMNIAECVAIEHNLPTAVFSLEMSRQQLVQRLMCSRARINLQRVRDGFLAERDFPALTAVGAKIAESKLIIYDDNLHYVDAVVAKVRRLKREKNIQLVVVDYLQLLNARGFKADNRQREVAQISAALKGLAKDLHIPIIVIAQLNRKPEDRHGGKPRLSDLRESGSIEQDADNILLLVRPEVYEDDDEARAGKAGEAELIIAKQRNGPVGEVMLTFLKEFTRFEDRARNVQPEML